MSLHRHDRFRGGAKLICAACLKQEASHAHEAHVRTACPEELDWQFWRLPAGWVFSFSFEEGGALVLACSVACADRLAREQNLREEWRTLKREEYDKTTRADHSPDETARKKAHERMRKKYGKEWTEIAGALSER